MIGAAYRLWLSYGPRPAGIRRRRLLEVLNPLPGEQLLEIGPGPGYYSLPVARHIQPHGRLVLVDVDQAMLDATVRRLGRRGMAGFSEARRVDAASLPFEDASFDGAFLVAVLGEVGDRPRALRELRRVLRPSGRLVVGETQLDPHALHRGQLREEVEAAGFRLEHQIGGRSYFARFRPSLSGKDRR